ncbi:MAG: DUF4350 domain-containing protein [Desulfobacterales bacterium]|nr:MAG: DUF4350 domain-containing protein [Desulfobacterales bacterium]
MRHNNAIRLGFLTLMLVFFLLGVGHLFILRFETGDVYPPYSSLRSDPLGTRAFYDSLDHLNVGTVRRNYRPLPNVPFDPQTTFFYLGAPVCDQAAVPAKLVQAVDRLTAAGGRLVLTFSAAPRERFRKLDDKPGGNCRVPDFVAPDSAKPHTPRGDPMRPQSAEPGPRESITEDVNRQRGKDLRRDLPLPAIKNVSLRKHWGINFGFKEHTPLDDDRTRQRRAFSHLAGLPAAISWHTALYFDELDSAWRVLYRCEGQAVVVERRFGKGSMVLAAESFFLSNEGLWSERYPELLVRLIGRPSQVVFDEAHFGINRRPGVAGLIRRYRFHWFLGGLAVLATLFVWQKAFVFVPPRLDDLAAQDHALVAAKDYTHGLISLLRRNIPRERILPICVQEWEKAFVRDPRFQTTKRERIKRVINATASPSKKQTDPVRGYQAIRKIITEDTHYE